MQMGWNQLKFDICSLEGLFHVMGAFIIQDVDARLLTMFLQEIKGSKPCFGYCTGVARLEWDSMDTISIIMVQYKDVLVAGDRPDKKFPCLVRVRLGWEVLRIKYTA